MTVTELVETIVRRYQGGRDRLFIVHGNTGDLFPMSDGRLLTLPDYLYEKMTTDAAARASRIWLHYSVGFGTRFVNGKESNGGGRMARMLGTEGEFRVNAMRQPADFLRTVDELCLRREAPAVADGVAKQGSEATRGPLLPLRIVMTEAHMVFPEAPTQFLRPEDRALLVQLQRFAREPAYDETNTLIVLVTDAITSVNRELREVAVALELSRPNEQEIAAHVDDTLERSKAAVADGALPQLRKLAVGLTRRQIANVVAEHVTARLPLTPDVLASRRRELIGRDYGEYLEFTAPEWTLDDVGGATEAVAEFRQLVAAIRRGDPDVPAGVIVGGQNGVGKTHLLKAFGGTAGITVVTLRPFKSSDYGGSERAQAKIITALTSAGQVIVIIEEADGTMGRRTGPNVHPVDKAILSQWLAVMGNPRYRGNIFWLLDTCRPDKLAPDLKRPGRCERIIPLFPETTSEGVRAVIRAQVGLLGRQLGYRFAGEFADTVSEKLLEKLIGKTGAQIKRALERTRRKQATDAPMTVERFAAFVDEDAAFKAEPEAYELQRLIAIAEAVETENADLVPKFYLDEVEMKLGGVAGLKRRIMELRARVDDD